MTISLAIVSFLIASPQTVGGGLDTLMAKHGKSNEAQFGYEVSAAGDLNNDGFDDVLVAEMYRHSLTGLVRAYSGFDKSILFTWSGNDAEDRFGWSLTDLGDINGDGHDDVLIGTRGMDSANAAMTGKAFVFSGADGSQLLEWSGAATWDGFGDEVADAGDVNLDGISDILIGAPGVTHGGFSSAGTVFLFSGADGSLIREWHGSAKSEMLGSTLSTAGDVNADGIADQIIGSSNTSFGGMTYPGTAMVVSGTDGSILHQWFGTQNFEEFGGAVSDIGDLNQDGFDDVIVGALGYTPGNMSSAGRVLAFSGADGSVIHEWTGAWQYLHMGYNVSNAGDFTGDGISDVLIGNFAYYFLSNFGHMALYDGATGAEVFAKSGDNYAQALSGAGDFNGDGRPDIIIGSYSDDSFGFTNGGSVSVLGHSSFISATTDQISISAGGRVDFTLNFPNDVAGQDYKLLASISGNGPIHYGVDIPLSHDGVLQKSWDGSLNGTVEGLWHGVLTDKAKSNPFLRIRPGTNPYLIGLSVQIAGVALEAGGTAQYSSEAVSVTFLP